MNCVYVLCVEHSVQLQLGVHYETDSQWSSIQVSFVISLVYKWDLMDDNKNITDNYNCSVRVPGISAVHFHWITG